MCCICKQTLRLSKQSISIHFIETVTDDKPSKYAWIARWQVVLTWGSSLSTLPNIARDPAKQAARVTQNHTTGEPIRHLQIVRHLTFLMRRFWMHSAAKTRSPTSESSMKPGRLATSPALCTPHSGEPGRLQKPTSHNSSWRHWQVPAKYFFPTRAKHRPAESLEGCDFKLVQETPGPSSSARDLKIFAGMDIKGIFPLARI